MSGSVPAVCLDAHGAVLLIHQRPVREIDPRRRYRSVLLEGLPVRAVIAELRAAGATSLRHIASGLNARRSPQRWVLAHGRRYKVKRMPRNGRPCGSSAIQERSGATAGGKRRSRSRPPHALIGIRVRYVGAYVDVQPSTIREFQQRDREGCEVAAETDDVRLLGRSEDGSKRRD
jgi:hypothetical protein